MKDTPKPVRIQLKRAKGWKMPANTVKVDRSTPWGNPFQVEKWHGSSPVWMIEVGGGYRQFKSAAEAQAGAVELFRTSQVAELIRRAPAALRGKNLACWCKPGTPCHADVLLELANC